MAADQPSFFAAPPRRVRLRLFPIRRIQRVGPDHARRPHHVENTRGEPEQQKHDHSPRRNPEPPVEQPADAGADQDAGDELGSTAENRGRSPTDRMSEVRRADCRRDGSVQIGRAVRRDAGTARRARPRRLALACDRLVACVVGHAFDTRRRDRGSSAAPRPRGPYWLGSGASQEMPGPQLSVLKSSRIGAFAEARTSPEVGAPPRLRMTSLRCYRRDTVAVLRRRPKW